MLTFFKEDKSARALSAGLTACLHQQMLGEYPINILLRQMIRGEQVLKPEDWEQLFNRHKKERNFLN
ncbi:hypothetical protein HM131_08710 [Halobacillus mangrovi]|uniref:Uncharacterized protein n=1 Tax=Halobacillus mangrovi TaxID=402384 RepID=A0A1W5ZUG2_9BACI|nr:hypothetical protein HM131_08710 [Halobacillus mangrovi]